MTAESADRFPSYAELSRTRAWVGGAQGTIAPGEGEPALEEDPRYTERAVLASAGWGRSSWRTIFTMRRGLGRTLEEILEGLRAAHAERAWAALKRAGEQGPIARERAGSRSAS